MQLLSTKTMVQPMPYARSFRIIARPEYVAGVQDLLTAENFVFEPEPFSSCCYKLVAEPTPLGGSLAAFFGYIYIQDRSSMLPPLALLPGEGETVLDMAASPGGKTGFLAQLVGWQGLVVGNEPARDRLATLRANLARANLLQTVTCSYPGENLPFAANAFANILLDPPCSGWGTVEKNPKALKLWQGAKIDRLVCIQRGLLRKACELLKPGGKLLYSTCTTNAKENQEQIAFAINELGFEPLFLAPFPGFVFEQPSGFDLLVNSRESQAQGFYLALLTRRQSAQERIQAGQQERNLPSISYLSPAEIAGPCVDTDLLPPGKIGLFGGKARFLPQAMLELWPGMARWQGPLLGKFKGTSFCPEARLRAVMPKSGPEQIVFDELEPIRKLLSGASLQVTVKMSCTGIYWRDLPLGICQIKNGRLLAAFY